MCTEEEDEGEDLGGWCESMKPLVHSQLVVVAAVALTLIYLIFIFVVEIKVLQITVTCI